MSRFLRSPILKVVLGPLLVCLTLLSALHTDRTVDWFEFGAWCLVATIWLGGVWLDRSRAGKSSEAAD